MKIGVLDNIPVATERSRRDLSIGELKFDVRIDYPSQKPLQSFGFLEFLAGPGPYPENNTAPRGHLEVQKNQETTSKSTTIEHATTGMDDTQVLSRGPWRGFK